MTQRREQASVLALVEAATQLRVEWHRIAALVDEAGSATRLLSREWNGFEALDPAVLAQVVDGVTPGAVRRFEQLIDEAEEAGTNVLTVLDDAYPTNLRHVYNRPPFLFVRGRLSEDVNRSVAVVGTRRPSPEGLEQARRLSRDLASGGVTVLSGLARGIDSAAHSATLDADGRTVAVMGTGISRIYPPENEQLARRILDFGGALVSQFWPEAPPTQFTFPMRNVVMSGMAVGTVVVEANSKSGARMQARLALDHGKRLFLVESLVMQEEWAQGYAKRPATTVIKRVEDILDVLVEMARPIEQLTLG